MPYNYTTLNTYCGGNSSDCNKPSYNHIDNSVYEGFSPGFSAVGVL